MKKLLLGVVLLLVTVTFSFGQLNFGAGIALQVDDSFFGIHGKVTNDFSEKFRGHGAFTYFFEKDDLNVWALDADLMFLEIVTIAEDVQLNPFAGINIARYSGGGFSNTDLGINIGVSLWIPSGDSLIIFIEPKFVIDGLDSFVITGGVMF